MPVRSHPLARRPRPRRQCLALAAAAATAAVLGGCGASHPGAATPTAATAATPEASRPPAGLDCLAGTPVACYTNPAIYRIGRSPAYRRAFHDITTGNNTVTYPTGTVTGYQAAPGWDPVTGWGSPDAQVLIPLLAQEPT
jgi:hypothetical protein